MAFRLLVYADFKWEGRGQNEKGCATLRCAALRMVSGWWSRRWSLYCWSAIMLRDGIDRPLCWTMRHRITSFRAVEPKSPLAGGWDPAENSLPVLTLM